MKKILFTLSMLLVMGVVEAQTVQVSGKQSGTWDADTVLVVGDIEVIGSLEVLPGTMVLFADFFRVGVADGAEFTALGSVDDSIVFTVADTTGLSNEFSKEGGWAGIQVKRGRVRLDYCVLQYGKAFYSPDAQNEEMEGGAMYIDGGDAEIAHSTLRCNHAYTKGGAVHAQDADLTMAFCAVNDNVVLSEGGPYGVYGGGLSMLRCHVDMRNMEFRRNYAPRCIGGALSLDSCKVDLHNAVFADNVGLNGGGMYMMRNNNFVNTLYNLAFYRNYSGHFAGGLAFCDSSPYVYNLLVYDNSSEGVNCNGVFFFEHSQPKMNNCIVYGNYPPEGSMLLDTVQMWSWTTDDYAPEFYNCLIEGEKKMISNSEVIKVFENVIDADPLFVDAENYDFHLQEGSPCRDAGNEFVPFDLIQGADLGGLRRVSNGRIDIGPYEYSEASVPQHEAEKAFARLIGTPLSEESRLMIELSRPQQVTVRLCSAMGQVVSDRVFEGVVGVQEWNLGDLAAKLVPGWYVVEVVSEERVCAIKTIR